MDPRHTTAGSVLAQAERSVGTAIHAAVKTYYEGTDAETARAIRVASSDDEAAKMVTDMRRGRGLDVLMIAASGIAGVAAGVLSQKVVGNYTIKKVPPVGALGLVPAGVGMAAPVGLTGRAALAVGGVAYLSGSLIYSILVPQEAAP
ncbi:MAG: hypothetical protein R3B09_35730 [Nannocystaceae bacterium]